jgi:hypothetical protein
MESQEGEEPQFDIPKGEALRAKFESYFDEAEEGKEAQPVLTPEEKKKELKRKLAQSKLGKVTKKEEEAPEEVKEACVLPKSTNVFEEISRIMHAILSENRGKNLKAKRLVIYNLLPSLVNKSKSFMQHLHSARFMVLIDDAMQVNWGSKTHQDVATGELLRLHTDFLNQNGVILADHTKLDEIISVLASLKRFKKDSRNEV